MENSEIKIIRIVSLVKEKALLFYKSRITRISAALLFSAIAIAIITPLFLNNASLKFQISQKISRALGNNFIIKGDVKISLLPHPKITADEIVIQNYKPQSNGGKIYNFSAESVEIIFPIFKFSDNLLLKKIIITDAILESYYEDKSPDNLIAIAKTLNSGNPETAPPSGISNKLFSIDDLEISKATFSKIPEIKIRNGQTIFFDNFGRKKEVKAINASFKITKKKIIAQGSFDSNNILSTFKVFTKFNSTAKKADSFIDIISPVFEFHISGNFTSENKFLTEGILANDFKGKITAEIAELKSFYQSYISNNDVISNKLKYNAKTIKFSADIENLAKEGSIKNLLITSSLFDGKGQAEFNAATEIPMVDIDLFLDNLDLDSMWSSEAIAATTGQKDLKNIAIIDADNSEIIAEENKQNPLPEIKKTINLNLAKKIKNFDLTAEIQIKNTKYLNGQIKDADLYLTVSKQGEILIQPMILKIPGEGILRINGALDNSSILPKFIGKIDVSGKNLGEVFKWLKIESQNLKFDNLKNYTFYSDIFLLPNNLTLNNLYLDLNNDGIELLGEVKIDNSNKDLATASRFQVSNFNVDDYFFTSEQNAYFSPGLLIKKLLWLNNISSHHDFNLTFDKLIYKQEEFLDQTLKLKVGHGYFEIDDLKLKSTKTDLKLDLAIDISDKNPQLNIAISGKNFSYKTPQIKTQNAATMSEKNDNTRNFFDQFYALPSLEGFGGKVMINLSDLKLDDLEVGNVKLSANLKDGNLDGANLSCDIYSGNLNYKGLIGIRLSKTINGNLTFNNASLKPLLSDIFGVNNIAGIINISANVTAIASTKNEFSKQLTSEVKFSANSPSIDGYGLSDLVRKMFSISNNQQELQNPEAILINSQSKTIFKQATGSFQISGGQGGKLRADISAAAMNAILSGTLDLNNGTIDALFNAIFLTGTREKQTPINIATSLKGPTNQIMQSTNLDQVKQYLGLISAPKIISGPANVQTTPAAQPTQQ